MEFNFQLQAMSLFVAVIFLFSRWRVQSNSNQSKRRAAPEPSGAWPIIGHPHFTMADKYGPAFMLQLGVNRTLVVCSWEMIKECFTTNDRAFATRPLSATRKHMGYDYAALGFTPYGPYWREMRKIATVELLSKTRIEMLKHVRINEIDLGIKELYSLWSKNNNSTHLVSNVDAGYEDEGQRFRKAFSEFAHLAGVFVPSDALPFLKWLDLGGYLGVMKCVANELDSLITNWLEEHHIHDKDLQYSHDSDTIIKAIILALVSGGSETTSLSLTWALSLLHNNHSHVGRDRLVEESDIKNLEYMNAIVKETLRLYPVAPLGIPHQALEDCQVGGYHVSKGTILMANIWKLERDPRVWLDPDEYKPERFFTTHANVDVRGQQFEFIPFSSGVRLCSSITFAIQILHLTLARLIHEFNLETPSSGPIDMSEGLALTLPKKNSVAALLTPRLPSNLYQL
ncbi:hypothetical protein NE237_013555 [Protea cynaroides]|uniref:Cytochrome P450 n=1 Tax=Protea cynaroides TaxID=273540 RepID=A0A9Q0H379_9MAGN|nr:hypothetical protein NE237_013555 [Protea cynaroides]